MRYVIAGNSYAAVGAVESIRARDPHGEIVIISDEPYRAYSRPLITYWIAGEVRKDQLDYRPAAWYERNRIQTRLGHRVTQVDPPNRQVVLEDGEAVAYDRLLICTGGTPIVPPIEGADAEGVFTMTRFDDARAFKAWCEQEHVEAGAIVGGGLIGLSVFKAMKGVKIKLTLVELLDRVLGLALDHDSSAMIEAALRRAGVDVRTASGAEAILKDERGRVRAVRLKGGEEVPCQTVVMAVGVRPNTGLLKESGIQINRGVVVNERMETSVPGVYAAGDVAEAYDVVNEQHQVIAILPLAYEQGRVAGANMAGGGRVYPGGIALNSLPIFDLPLMTMGITLTDGHPNPSTGSGRVLDVLVHSGDGVYRKLVFQGDRLVGAILVGNVAHGGVLTWLIRSKLPVTHDRQALLTGDPLEIEIARQLNAVEKSGPWVRRTAAGPAVRERDV
ncbi:MAG: FAD-dependent oxidoreductase [Ardenticatenaceae bacterium]|nr:FAD-dependent oxidoreductase [Ardenticatenaceae bacterium]HBY94902.1 NAD(P)/FAD-dependent oxidoreductase [Chloroflexota bacterium]